MAALTLFLGPSFPSLNSMPLPSAWRRHPVKVGAENTSANGTLYAQQFGLKYEWQGEWVEISAAELALIVTEFQRTRSLALVDLDATSWTVVASFSGLEISLIEGTNPPQYNARISLREK